MIIEQFSVSSLDGIELPEVHMKNVDIPYEELEDDMLEETRCDVGLTQWHKPVRYEF